MKVKNLFSALLVVAVFVSASFAATITPVQPTLSKSCYQIGTAAELYGFAAIVNGTDGMTRRAKACGKLTADIVVNKDVLKSDGSLNGDGSNFIPWKIIKSFSGTFDGQGHTISGLYLVDDDYESVGFIDQIVSSTYESPVIIQNLGIVNSYFEGGYVSVFVNGVYNSDSTLLRNSFSAVTIKAYQDAEGLIGWTSGSHVSIDNCFSFNKFEPGDYDMSPITRSSSGDKVARIKNSFFVDTLRSSIGGLGVSVDDFKNGMVATMLHYSANGSIWGQTVGTDPYPVFSGKLSGNIGNITTSDIALYTYLGDTAKYNLKYVEGKGVDLPAIVRTGYFFAGWYTNEDLDGDPVYSVDSTATGAKAFYAKWVHLPNLVNGCYEISNADEMYGFASITRREYRKYKSGKLCGKLVKDIVINNNVLKEDRTLNGDGKNFEVWEPFEWFKGSFDGQGHSIWGLFIKDTSRSLLGLFRGIDGDDNRRTRHVDHHVDILAVARGADHQSLVAEGIGGGAAHGEQIVVIDECRDLRGAGVNGDLDELVVVVGIVKSIAEVETQGLGIIGEADGRQGIDHNRWQVFGDAFHGEGGLHRLAGAFGVEGDEGTASGVLQALDLKGAVV